MQARLYKMDHYAILERSGLVMKQLLEGAKTIESRWTMRRIPPYDEAQPGDRVFFGISGSRAATAMGIVEKTEFHEVDQAKIEQLLKRYGREVCMTMDDYPKISDRKYCSLIWLPKVERIKPIPIDKTGYGYGVAWISVDDISKLHADNHH